MYLTATIASGGTVSSAIDLGATASIRGLVMPSAFTGTAITFQVSHDGVTYQALYDDAGSAVSVSVAASRNVSFKADDFHCLCGWRFIRLVSGSAEAAERSVGVWAR